MKTEGIRDRFMPWSGLALGTLGVGLAHQIGSDATFQDCQFGSPAVVIAGVLIGLLLVALGALGSWRVCEAEAETPARKLVALVSVMACALFALAIVLPLIASVVIPRCWA